MASDKQSFLRGTAILTVAALATKVIGALFKLPLTRLLGAEGAGHFSVAYNIYILLLNLSSTGLPLAVSRLISEAHALGRIDHARSIHRTALMLFLTMGGLCSGAMFFGARPLALWMRDPDAVFAIRTLAPAVLFVCISSAYRGWFQGQQYMTPTAVAQVLEALCKLFLGLAAVLLALRAGWAIPQTSGAAISGVTVGAVLGSVYLIGMDRRTPAPSRAPKPTAQIAVRILRLAVPITIGATGVQVVNALSGRIILGRLQDALGYSVAEASALYGIYSMAQTLYLLPPAIVQPLTVSVLPAVTAALARGDREDARKKERSALALAALVAVPAGGGLFLLSGPIQWLLYGYDAATLSTAAPVLSILGIGTTFYCFTLVTNAILQARGKGAYPVVSTVVGGVANLAVTHILVSDPRFGILGAAVGTLLYGAAALGCNVLLMNITKQEDQK